VKLVNIETLLIILTTYGVGLTSTFADSAQLLDAVKSDLQSESTHEAPFTPLSCVEDPSGETCYTEPFIWDDSSGRFDSMWSRIFSNDQLYSAYTAWEIKPGNERVLGDGQIMVPLWQTSDSLLFADLRGQMDDQSSYEGNWGLGFRQIRDDSWILGAYGFYDLRHTEYGNDFNQGTFGLEALSVEWEARVNGYIPETGTKSVSSLNGAGISNGTIVVRAGEERAYHGVDAEIGKLLNDWCDGDVELRGYVGGYHFDTNAGGYPHISGPRGRVELRAYDLNCLGEGSRVTIGGELQWDEVRDTQVFAMLRVRIPLGPSNDSRQLTRLERRMLDRVVRDVDVVAHAQQGPEEAAINPLTGREFGQVEVVDANGNLQTAVNTADVNGTVIVSGAAGQLNPANTINLQEGQTLLGGGSSLQVTGANSGLAVTFTAPGSRPVISQASPTKDVIKLADNAVVYGNTIDGGFDSLDVTNIEGSIVVQNNVIQNSSRHGLNISLSGSQSLSAHVENNQFVNVDDDAIVATVFGSAQLDLSNSIVGNTFLGMNNTNSAVRLEINASSGDTPKITASIRDNVISDLNQDGVFLDIDDTGEMVTTITNNQFLRIAGDGVEISVEDHDDGNVTQTTTVTNNQFTDITGAGVRIETNDNDSDDDYLITQNTTITGNTFLRNGTGVAIQYDSDSDSDGGEYVSNTTIATNKFLAGTGDGINLNVSDWDDEDLTIDLAITNNEFATHAGDAIDLSVGDIDLDSGVVVFRPMITGNAFTGTAQDNIRINVSDEASLAGSILNNTITGGLDGIDILSGGIGTNTLTIGGNVINAVTGTGIQLDSTTATTISDSGLNNTVTTPGTVFNFDNQGNLGGSQILINGVLEP
tara:strand:- start:10414 stop:13026 length:2613 start_codon:yes stop_codon:yes gene_type:complete